MAIKALVFENHIITEISDQSRALYDKSRFGTIQKNGQLQLSFVEGIYLFETNKIEIYKGKKILTHEQLFKIAKKYESKIWTRYCCFKDLRDKGYIVKTALKFGADFRVYDKGIKPGEDHAKWVVYPVPESEVFSWHDFSAKNRVAHSTKKRLMIGVVDDEGDVTYYEINWLRP